MKGHLRRCFAIREEEINFQPLRRSGADCRSALRAHVRPSTLRAQAPPSALHLAFPEQALHCRTRTDTLP
jgi:hypothetical protein